MRSIILVAVPSFAAIIGFFWFWRKKRPPGIADKKNNTTDDDKMVSKPEEDLQVLSDQSPELCVDSPCVTEEISLPDVARVNCSGDGLLPPEIEDRNDNNINGAGDGLGQSEVVDEPLCCALEATTSCTQKPQSYDWASSVPFDLEDEAVENIDNVCTKSAANNNYKNSSENQVIEASKLEDENLTVVEGKNLSWSYLSSSQALQPDLDSNATQEDSVNIQHVGDRDVKGDIADGKIVSAEQIDGHTCGVVEAEVARVTGSLTHSNSHSPAVGSPVENASVTSSNGSGSDVPSEVSADSGRGASLSDVGSPPLKESNLPEPTIYDFEFPTRLCGKLIGKNGRNINVIKERSGADISVQRNPYTPELQIVHLEGSKRHVYNALDMVKQRFPPRKFRINYAALEQPAAVQESPVLPAEIMQLNLPEGCTVDVLISSVVTPNHLFLQQPTHPTFPMLERQTQCMLLCYTQDTIVPQLPRPIDVGTVCAAPMFNGWYRAQVVETYPDTDEAYIRFVDYGGYLRMQSCLLRQIRSDFTTLPFQAIECYMANVVPPGDDDEFSVEANVLMEQLVQGKLLQAEVVGHESDATPYIQVYMQQPDNTLVFVNRELVDRGVARWLEHPV